MIHVVAFGGLRRSSMSASIVSDDPKTMIQKEQHLCIPII
jgi:hypothetical protein